MLRSLLACSLIPLTALAASVAAAPAAAQTATQSIEVRAPLPVRTDIATLCPGIEAELPDALARVAREVAEPALLEVSFALDGRRIADVTASGGPRAYGRAVRQAVRGLACDNAEAGRQTVRLRVRFVDPFAGTDGRAVALVEPAAARR